MSNWKHSPLAGVRAVWLSMAMALLGSLSVHAEGAATERPAAEPSQDPKKFHQPGVSDPTKENELFFSPDRYAFVALAREPKLNEEYQRAPSMARRLSAWRNSINYLGERINTQAIEARVNGGSPISQRYIVTLYGGVIDMRRFLYVAARVTDELERDSAAPIGSKVVSRKISGIPKSEDEINNAVSKVLVAMLTGERGEGLPGGLYDQLGDPKLSFTDNDLPSCAPPPNYFTMALGAYYAVQIQRAKEQYKGKDIMAMDIEIIFEDLIAKFIPLPDTVVSKFSFIQAAMGLNEAYTRKEQYDRLNWYTAIPLVQTKRFNDKAAELGLGKLGPDVANGKEALAKVGFEVYKLQNKYPIALRSLK